MVLSAARHCPESGYGLKALWEHITGDLPAGSSLRRNSVTRVATQLGAALCAEDFNFFVRELQLGFADLELQKAALDERAPVAAVEPRTNTESAPAQSGSLKRPFAETPEASTHEQAAKRPLAAVAAPLAAAAARAARVADAARATDAATSASLEAALCGAEIAAICTQACTRRPVLDAEGRPQEGNIRAFAETMLAVAESPEDWEAAWQLAGFISNKGPPAARIQAGFIVVRSVLELTAESGEHHKGAQARGAGERGACAVAGLVRAFCVRVRVAEDAVGHFISQRGGRLQDCAAVSDLLSRLLSHCFPRPRGSDWGWPRSGWCWAEWWALAERMLGNADHRCALEILHKTSESLEALGAGARALEPLQLILEDCRWAQAACGLGPVGLPDDRAK